MINPTNPAPVTKAEQLWAAYYRDTELFDRTLPGAWSEREPDCWLPLDKAASNRHAKAKLDWLSASLREHGIDNDAAERARIYVSGLSFSVQARLAGQVI